MDVNSIGTVVWGPKATSELIWAWRQWMLAQRKGAPRSELLAAEQALRDIANASD